MRYEMILTNTRQPIELVATFTVLAWLGEYIHNKRLYNLPISQSPNLPAK